MTDPTASPDRRAPVRAGDAERDAAVDALREHLSAGRLTIAEFTERMDAALRARYRQDLPALFADLPALPTGRRPGRGQRPAGSPAHWAGPAPIRLLFPVLLVLFVLASTGAHGHPPVPLLWLGLLLAWVRIARARSARP